MIKNDISVRTTKTRRPSGARLLFARVLSLFFLLFLVIAPRPVAAIGPVNGDFEEGHLWDYILYPSARQVKITEGFLQREDYTPVFAPMHGSRYFGLVIANQMDVYSRLITAPFVAVAGQTISGYAFFQTDEYLVSHNDEGQVAILSGGVEVKVVFSQSVGEIGPVNRTDWTYWEYTIPEGGGIYQVEARVVNRGDGQIGSAVGIDSISLRDAPAPNTAPLLSPIGDKTVNEGATLDFTAFAIDNDPGDVLTYSLTGNVPEGAEFDPITGRFTWTPSEEQGPGEYKLVVVVTDNGVPAPAADFEEIIITVAEVNQAPEMDPIADSTLHERIGVLSYTAAAYDADLPANTLSYSLVGAPAGASIDRVTGKFTWTASEEQGPGTYTFAIRATDNGNPSLSTEQPMTVQVKEVNSAPDLAPIGDKTVDEEKPLTFTVTATDEDIPANRLTYSLAGAPEGASIDPATGKFTWTPSEKQDGTHRITVRVTDDGEGSLWDEERITITVAEVNKPPVVEPIANKTVKEGELLNFVATGIDPDHPRDLILYSLVDAPAGAHIKEVLGEFNWTPGEDQGGRTYTLAVRVTEEHASHMTAEKWFTITVLEDNKAPELAPIGDKTVKEGASLTFTASAKDADLPANTLSYSLVGAPSRASIHPSTGVFTWTPHKSQSPGTYTFTVRVTDNGKPSSLWDEEKITVRVTAANDAPDANPTPPGGGPVTVPGTPPGFPLLRVTDFQPLLAPTNSAGSGAATITLQTTLQDFTALPGDITGAVVSIMNRETGQVLASGLSVTRKPLLGLAVGMANHTTTVNIGPDAFGQTFQACVLVAGGYTRDSTYDDALVTVYRPLPNFLVGGGYLVNQGSTGSLTGDAGQKTHFGMTVKFDLAKNGKPENISGQATLLIRSGGQVYQVRTNSITKLDLRQNKGEAEFEGKATIRNITNPKAAVMVDADARFAITLTDRGEPGSSDTLSVTLWNGGTTYFSSGPKSNGRIVEQTLGSGNLQLR